MMKVGKTSSKTISIVAFAAVATAASSVGALGSSAITVTDFAPPRSAFASRTAGQGQRMPLASIRTAPDTA